MDKEKRLSLRNFGYNLGIAFQLTDDMLDYISCDNILGKHVGTDLKEGKVTLPLIHTLKLTNEKEKTSIKKVLDKNKVTIKDFERVRNIILKYGGIDYTSTIAKQYIDTAKKFLNIFQTSPYKNALLSLADYMLKREM